MTHRTFFLCKVLRIISAFCKEHCFVETNLSTCEDINLELCILLFFNIFDTSKLLSSLSLFDFIHLMNFPSIRYIASDTRRTCILSSQAEHSIARCNFRVYSDWMRQRQCDGVKHDALVLEHMLVNRSIHTDRF